MALLIAMELGTLMFSIKTLSSVRALVGAEGLWSKAQKNAAFFLQKYGRTRNTADYNEYHNCLKVPLGDSKTRRELAKPDPDMSIARQGFLEGRVHPDDIDGAIKLFRRFHKIYYINKAIGTWTKGDSLMAEFMAIGDELHNEIISPNSSDEKISQILSKVDNINDELTLLEDEFSFTLGEGSRWLTGLILKLLLGLVLTVEICGLSITILVSRGISKGLNNIITTADKIGAGDFSSRAQVYSRDEIGILASAFNDMAEKLQQDINAITHAEEKQKASKEIAEKSLAVKGNFLANMSHEIRTPMNAVIGFTKLMEGTKLDEHQQEIIHAIKVSSQSLMTLINDILDYSRLESGKIVLERIPFSIKDTVESLKVLLQQKAEEKKLALWLNVDANIPEKVIGDPARLMQILLNLSDNAIKFTEKGSVAISVSRLDSSDDDLISLEFKVKDTGKGIPEDKFAEIFERFTQVSAETTRKHGGTGLGLSIVKGLLELQNGTLSLQSKEGDGTLFTFNINYGKASTVIAITDAQKQTPHPREDKDAPLNILVVEDNPINQMLAMHVLKKYKLNADLAENGEMAVAKMKEKHFDLILMDIQMPIMDGYEATRIIRNELKSNIPIIALTAHAMSEEKEKCLGMGMNDFISKPFDQKHLYDTIIRLCNVPA
ncbi:MAG: luxQ 1 [Flavipsychrobacter sp.]|nr:luxQ 1 [Flavipsychrobacter sp.]